MEQNSQLDVWRVEQPVLRDGTREVRIERPWLDDGEPVVRIYLDDPVHSLQREDDAAVLCVGGTGQAAACSLRDDGDAEFGCRAQSVLDVTALPCDHNRRGHAGRAEQRLVVAVGFHPVRVVDHRPIRDASAKAATTSAMRATVAHIRRARARRGSGTMLAVNAAALTALEPELAAVPGTVSVWCGRPDSPAGYSRNPDVAHYAASTMKVGVMAAAYRLADGGRLSLDADVRVHDDFQSRSGAGTFRNDRDYDNDEQPWERLGGTAPLRWLIRRMIVKSSNLATNAVLEQVWARDPEAVAAVWRDAGAKGSVTARGIEDYAAQKAGLTNLVTAAALAALLAAIWANRLASPSSCAEMLDVLLAQEVDDDIVQGLPEGTRVAHKNGWVEGIRHSAALILPADAPEFVLVTCVSAPLSEAAGRDLLARITAAAWADRNTIAAG
jgi:beta-lactamase class A